MKTCKVCGNPKSQYIMNNRSVCMKCDDLVFDLEIECDEDQNSNQTKTTDKTPPNPNARKNTFSVKKQFQEAGWGIKSIPFVKRSRDQIFL